MKVLMSIKPKYADKIFSGEKKWEYRKKLWKRDDVDIVVVYASAPISKVIGEFNVERSDTIHATLKSLWYQTGQDGGVSKEEFEKYFIRRCFGIAISVSEPTLYDTPKPLSDYGIKRPPQNFMYLPDEGGIDER
jgi:predicted transcriptional regulator